MITFKLHGTPRPIYLLPTKHSNSNNLMVKDEKTGRRRELRYSEREPSIWADEQNPKSPSTMIQFDYGILHVDEDKNPTIVEFLKAIPSFGKLFSIVDEKAEAKTKNDLMKQVSKAFNYVSEAGSDIVEGLIASLVPALTDAPIEMQRSKLYDLAQKDPEIILALSSAGKKEEVDNHALALNLIKNKVVQESDDKKGVFIVDTGDVFIPKNHNKKTENAVAEWLSDPNTDKGTVDVLLMKLDERKKGK